MLKYLFYTHTAETGSMELGVLMMKKTTIAMVSTFVLFLAAAGLVFSGTLAIGMPDSVQDSPANDCQVIPGNDPHVIPGNDPHTIADASSLVIPGNDPHGWTWADMMSLVIPGNDPH